MSRTKNIGALFAPCNIVLVGASDRNWAPRIWDNLARFGFEGQVYPVNPNRSEIWGARCYSSISDLPEPPDHLALFVPKEQTLEALEEAGKLGARSATIFAAGFGEGGDADGLARAERLRSVLDRYSIAATGPNCMGLAVGRSRFCTFPDEQLQPLTAGPVAALTQSGMLGQTFARGLTDAGLQLAYLISCGNQTGLTFADYIDHLADDPDLKVITCYIESVKDGAAFLAAAMKAQANGKTLVVVKAGGSEEARKAALAHTGSLAGSTEVFDAFAQDAGIVRVDTLEDMVEAAAYLARMSRPKGRGVAIMTNSGALKSLATDACATYGVPLTQLDPATGAKMRETLKDADLANPFDSKRTLTTDEYMAGVRALHDDPNVDLLLMAEEIPRAAGVERKIRNLTALDAFAAQAAKPIVAFAPVTLRESDYMAGIRQSLTHLPWMRDVGKTLRTVSRLLPSAMTPATRKGVTDPKRAAIVAQWKERARQLSQPTALSETESKDLLAAYGLQLPQERVVQTTQSLVEAAQQIGFPVVLKAVSADVPHKSDAGLVLLSLADADAVRKGAELLQQRCRDLNARLEGILVAEQVQDGVEMVLGLHHDPEMGHAVMVGMGGVWLELFKDVAFAPPALDLTRARETIAQTRAHQLLQGYRGSPPRDVDALARAMVALGDLSFELGDVVEAVDVNPLLVRAEGRGAVALDALVILRPPQK